MIAEVTFRLHPLPAQTQVWGVTSRDPEVLGFLMMKILDSQLSVQAVQMRGGEQGCALDVELASQPDVIAQQAEKLNVLARGFGGSCDAAGDGPLAVRRARAPVQLRRGRQDDDVAHCVPALVRDGLRWAEAWSRGERWRVLARRTPQMLSAFV